jgi:hypothetical protein
LEFVSFRDDLMNWQDYLAIAFFFAAAAYVAWRAWRALFAPAKAGCGSGCGSCASNDSKSQSKDLLTIESPSNGSRGRS